VTSDSDWQDSTVGRVALALLAFGDGGEGGGSTGLTVTTVAQRIGRERSQVSRMLKTLAGAGLLEQDPVTKAYRLGWRMYHLASRAGDHQLLMVAKPALRDLVALTKETALVSVLSGNRSFTVARERSPQSLQAGGWVGRTSPLHASASGRALILMQADDAIGNLVRDDLGAPGLGPKAPTTVETVLKVVRAERARGFTLAMDQLEDGLTSVGAPIIDSTGHVLAALNVSGPTSRMRKHVDWIGRDLLTVCRRISSRLH
jgi:DNA-binding IclR family transcriptional regulator